MTSLIIILNRSDNDLSLIKWYRKLQSQIDWITISDYSNDISTFQPQIDRITISDYSNEIAIFQPIFDWITVTNYSNDISSLQLQIDEITISDYSIEIANYNLKFDREKIQDETNVITNLQSQIDWITIPDYSNDTVSLQMKIDQITIPNCSIGLLVYNLKLFHFVHWSFKWHCMFASLIFTFGWWMNQYSDIYFSDPYFAHFWIIENSFTYFIFIFEW
jgi:hypothetical protein